MTLKQEKELKQQELFKDLNYAIDSIIIDLSEEHQNNLFSLYNYYLNNKFNLIDKIYVQVSSLKIEKIEDVATDKGFILKKILVSKHNLNYNNEYETRILIETLLKNKINEFLKEKENEEKIKEKLYNNYADKNIIDNKSPPKIKKDIAGLSPFAFFFAVFIGICEAFESTKKRR